MREPHEDAQTTQVMASLRRLKAAFAASNLPDRIPSDVIIAEIRRILDSDGLRNLLAHSTPGFFCDTIRQVRDVVDNNRGAEQTMERLRNILESKELNAALASDDPDEQSDRLLQLMLDGPYKDAPRLRR